jgi:hypothetical protein
MPSNVDLQALLPRNEAGEVCMNSDVNEYGWVRLEAVREAVKAFDEWAAETPNKVDPMKARLAIGPVVDTRFNYAPVGWYIDLNERD